MADIVQVGTGGTGTTVTESEQLTDPPEPVQVIQGPETNLCFPHSLSFHPTLNHLVVSSSQGRQNINIFEKVSDEPPYYCITPMISLEILTMYDESTLYLLDQLHQEGGCKGAAFAPDGSSLAVTQNLCADNLKLPFNVGVLAVYNLTTND